MDDLISRQDAIDGKISIQRTNGVEIYSDEAVPVEYLKALPPAQPEREKGKWIWKTGDVYKCSECETETHVDECFEEPIYNYCPYCNAFMDGYDR